METWRLRQTSEPVRRDEGRTAVAFAGVAIVLGLIAALGWLEPLLGLVFGAPALVLGVVSARRLRGMRYGLAVAFAGAALGAYGVIAAAVGASSARDSSPPGTTSTAFAPTTAAQPLQPPVTNESAPPPPAPPPPPSPTRTTETVPGETVAIAVTAGDRGLDALALTLLGPFVGVAAAVSGAWIARRERQAGRRAQSLKEAAAVVVPVQSLLDDADPRRLALIRDSPDPTADLWRRWTHQVRDPLRVLASTHAATKVSDQAGRLTALVSESLTRTAAVVRTPEPEQARLEEAVRLHREASDLARELLKTLRRRSIWNA